MGGMAADGVKECTCTVSCLPTHCYHHTVMHTFCACSMGGMAAEGVGYGIAYVYAEGLVESLGITAILESAYKKGQAQSGDGCKAVNAILDSECLHVSLRCYHVGAWSYSCFGTGMAALL